MQKNRQNSAQILVLTALLIALIMVSVEAYIMSISSPLKCVNDLSEGLIRNFKAGSRNVVIGCLSNISRGSSNLILKEDIERWIHFLKKHCYWGELSVTYKLTSDSRYSDGVWILWREDGVGVSSASMEFVLNLENEEKKITFQYLINVTTFIRVKAVSDWKAGIHKITITIHLYNEGRGALAKNITIFYQENFGNWTYAGALSSYRLTDYGNGTYIAYFEVGPPRTFNRKINVNCLDQRSIFVQANTTCIDV